MLSFSTRTNRRDWNGMAWAARMVCKLSTNDAPSHVPMHDRTEHAFMVKTKKLGANDFLFFKFYNDYF